MKISHPLFKPVRIGTAVSPSALALITLALFTLGLTGCNPGAEAKREKEHEEAVALLNARVRAVEERASEIEAHASVLATRATQLETKANLLTTKAESLDSQEATLRAREDLLKAQEKSIAEQILLLEKRQKEILDLEATVRRGPAPEILAERAVVIDAESGVVLFEKNADEPCAVASTQKLLTGLIVAETGELDTMVTVEEADTDVEPVKLYIKTGEQIPRRTILNGLLIKSGNDLALCLARDCAGSIEAFAKKMNRRAKELGMTTSHFVNPHGLTEAGQQSTASDMAKLARAAYHNPIIRAIVCQKSFVFEHGDGTKIPINNTNRVLRNFEPCNGMKTGFTNASKSCLVCSGEQGDLARIVVVLGSDGGSYCAKDAQALLEWSLKG